MSGRFAWVAFALVGCAGVAAPAVPPRAAEKHAEPQKKAEPLTLHTFVRGFPGTPERPSRLRLCPIEGETFLCGVSRIYALRDREFVAAPQFERGLPHADDGHLDGQAKSFFGRFPSDAWLLFATRKSDEPYAYYRWEGDCWKHAFTPPSVPHSLSYSLMIVRGGKHPLFVTSDRDAPSRLFAPNGGLPPDLKCAAYAEALPDSVLFTGAPCGSPHFTRVWPDGKRRIIPTPNISWSSMTFDDAERPIVAGGIESPELRRLDGSTWTALDTNGIAAGIETYVRQPNAEWAYGREVVYRKPTGGAWTVFAGGAHGMWVTGPDDVWVLRWEGMDGVLLRAIPPNSI